ncbi:MAG: hypothetical protein ABEH81_04030 [Halopenitus sp.]
MTRLDSDFEDAAREAFLDEVEHELVGKRNNLVFQAIQQSHEVLREAANRFDYHVEPVIESLGEVEVTRTRNSIEARWGWNHEASVFFEFGTSTHTVDGDPILSFVWEASRAPRWVAREFDREGDGYRVFFPETEPTGMRELRFVRDATHWLRRQL